MARFDCAPAKQQAVFPYRYAAGDDLRILVMYSRTGLAYVAGPIVTFRDSFRDPLSTVAAIVHLKVYLARPLD